MAQILINPEKRGYGYFKFKNSIHNIFYGKGGVDRKILQRAFEQVDHMQSYYSKVRVIFLEFHQSVFSANNKEITRLMTTLKAHIAKKYKSRVGYIWVRERNRAHAQHYHLAVMINGHTCKNGWPIQQFSHQAWQAQNPDNTSYFVKRETYHLVRDDHTETNAARLRLSYFAKQRTKEHGLKCNNFSASRIALNPKGKFNLCC